MHIITSMFHKEICETYTVDSQLHSEQRSIGNVENFCPRCTFIHTKTCTNVLITDIIILKLWKLEHYLMEIKHELLQAINFIHIFICVLHYQQQRSSFLLKFLPGLFGPM